MALECQTGIGRRHALAVVDNLDKGAPGIFQHNLNRGGPGIDSILDQLLDYRSRALYHFACRNLIGHRVGQQMDYIAHNTSSFSLYYRPNRCFFLSSSTTSTFTLGLRKMSSGPVGLNSLYHL